MCGVPQTFSSSLRLCSSPHRLSVLTASDDDDDRHAHAMSDIKRDVRNPLLFECAWEVANKGTVARRCPCCIYSP